MLQEKVSSEEKHLSKGWKELQS